jgi:hypothetical protein
MSNAVGSKIARPGSSGEIWRLVLVTVACALAASALGFASALWTRGATTLMVALLGFAITAAISLRPGGWRGFWLGYAVVTGLLALPVLFDWDRVRNQLLPFELERLAGWMTTIPAPPATALSSPFNGSFVSAGQQRPNTDPTRTRVAAIRPEPRPPITESRSQAETDYRRAVDRYENRVRILRVYAVLLAGLCGCAVGAWLAVRSRTANEAHGG